jgi:sugar phosphate isomerase/epimerase
MRLGAPIPVSYAAGPEAWAAAQRAAGYSAVYVPFGPDADEATVTGFRDLCARNDLLIAEVGAWSNPISPDEATRKAAIEKCCRCLDLADRLGARCCVNIAGARGEQWDGPHPDNLSEETFDLIVETVREILDAVRPTRTFYTLETMPWVFPDSPERYARLIEAIDRERFAVHFDPVNFINSPERFFRNADFLRHCFALLGPHIKACHAKDITLAPRLTVHLDEVRPGLGALDYGTLLREMNRLDPDTPFLLEHLPNPEEYVAAAAYVRDVAAREGITFR